jgi:hypothetical protein
VIRSLLVLQIELGVGPIRGAISLIFLANEGFWPVFADFTNPKTVFHKLRITLKQNKRQYYEPTK